MGTEDREANRRDGLVSRKEEEGVKFYDSARRATGEGGKGEGRNGRGGVRRKRKENDEEEERLEGE